MAHRCSEATPAPHLLFRRARPGAHAARAGERRRHRRLTVEQLSQFHVGGEAGPAPVDDPPDRVEHRTPARSRERGRSHDRTEHLRRGRAVAVELDDEVPVLAEHAMARPVEAVDVVLEPVPQRDARDGETVARLVEQPRQQLALLLGYEREVDGDDRRDQGDAVAAARRREIRVIDRDATRRHVPAGVADRQLGEEHGVLVGCMLQDLRCRATAASSRTATPHAQPDGQMSRSRGSRVGSARARDDQERDRPDAAQRERDHPEAATGEHLGRMADSRSSGRSLPRQ